MVRPIMVTILGDDASLQRALARSSAATDSFGARMQAAGRRISGVGKTLTHNLTLPILGVGVAAVKMGIDFQKQMEMVHTQAGASQGEVNKLSKAVLALAPSTTQGPGELAKALFHVESVGFRGAKAMDVLKVASQGAQIGQASLEDTASALSAVTITNIKGTENYQHAMAILNATIGAGNMRMQDLLEALKSGIVPTAKVAGLSLQGLAAALAMMTDEGVPAGTAANRLRTALLMMTNPTAKAQAAMKSVGLSALDMAHQLQKPDGLVAALTLLRTHMESIHDPAKRLQLIGELFGGSRSAGTIALLLNNLDRVSMKYAQIGKTSAKFGQDLAASNETASAKLQKAWSAIQVALIKAGAALAPTFLKIADAVARAATAFSKLSGTQKDIVLIGLASAAAAGPLLRFGGAMVQIAGLAGKAATAVGLFTPAIAGAGAATATAGSDAAVAAGVGGFGALALVLAPLAVAVGGLTYLWVTNKKASDGLGPAYKRIEDALKGLPGALNKTHQASETAAQALKHLNQVVKETPNNMDRINKAQTRYENLLRRSSGETLKYHAQLTTLNHTVAILTGAEGKHAAALGNVAAHYKGTRAAGYAMAVQTSQLSSGVQGLIAKLTGAGSQAGALALKMQHSDPALASTARHTQAVALAAAEVARRINAIPTFKQVTIQMQIDEMINRLAANAPPPGRPGPGQHRSGSRNTASTANTQPVHVHVFLDGQQIRQSLIKAGTMSGQPVLRGT